MGDLTNGYVYVCVYIVFVCVGMRVCMCGCMDACVVCVWLGGCVGDEQSTRTCLYGPPHTSGVIVSGGCVPMCVRVRSWARVAVHV